MAAKKKARRKKSARKSVSSSPAKVSSGSGMHFLKGLLWLVLKVVGIAFLVQGFIWQLATGYVYYGMMHYAIGLVLVMLACHWKGKCK